MLLGQEVGDELLRRRLGLSHRSGLRAVMPSTTQISALRAPPCSFSSRQVLGSRWVDQHRAARRVDRAGLVDVPAHGAVAAGARPVEAQTLHRQRCCTPGRRTLMSAALALLGLTSFTSSCCGQRRIQGSIDRATLVDTDEVQLAPLALPAPAGPLGRVGLADALADVAQPDLRDTARR